MGMANIFLVLLRGQLIDWKERKRREREGKVERKKERSGNDNCMPINYHIGAVDT